MAFGFSNAGRFKRRLKAIPPAVRKASREQLMANAEDLVEAQKRAAPHEDGVLRDSIRSEDRSDVNRISVQVRAGGATTTKPVRVSEKGNAPEYDYALAQELGTQDMPANPFFYPPYRARRRGFKTKMTRAAKGAIAAAVRSS